MLTHYFFFCDMVKYLLNSRCCRQSDQTRRKTYGPGEIRTHDNAFRGIWSTSRISCHKNWKGILLSNPLLPTTSHQTKKNCQCVKIHERTTTLTERFRAYEGIGNVLVLGHTFTPFRAYIFTVFN